MACSNPHNSSVRETQCFSFASTLSAVGDTAAKQMKQPYAARSRRSEHLSHVLVPVVWPHHTGSLNESAGIHRRYVLPGGLLHEATATGDAIELKTMLPDEGNGDDCED